jgi:hypothetical protein
MIEYLEVGRTAHFFQRKKRLSGEAVERLFRTLRRSVTEPSQNLFYTLREPVEGCLCSAICFSFKQSPSFLDEASGVTDRVHGFFMLVEKGGHVAISKAGLELPGSFKAEYLSKIAVERVNGAIAQQDAVFKRVRLKHMGRSAYGLRAKSFEAPNLENAVPTAGANRFYPLGYQLAVPGANYTATPSTGRISAQGQRAGLAPIAAWSGDIIDRLGAEQTPASAFLRHFATPVDLEKIPRDVRPTFVAIDTVTLADALLDAEAPLRLVTVGAEGSIPLGDAQIAEVLAALDADLPVRITRQGPIVQNAAGQAEIARLRFGKTRIGLHRLSLPEIEGLSVENSLYPPGEDPEAMPLARYIDREDLFTILFSDIALTYDAGALYRDEALIGGGEHFLRHLIAEPRLAVATSEKGDFAEGQIEFSEDSVFRIVADNISSDCDILLCDDLNDEWADFIGLSTRSNPATINFYHAKHGDLSLGASSFHAAVGQALKNLGRMALDPATMVPKYASWAQPYRNGNAETAIPRVMRSDGDVEQVIAAVSSAPDHLKRVFIVTSSLSRAAVADVFARAAEGQAPRAHFVQLYCLLDNYFSACSGMDVRAYVICRP